MLNWRALFLAACLTVGVIGSALAASRRGELRGVWMSEIHGSDWPAVMQSLHDNGFNAIFPYFSIGDRALYPSRVLALAPGGDPDRDELAEAVRAAREQSIEIHVWRISWALFRTPADELEALDAAGRLQCDARGRRAGDDPSVEIDWLCPSHPENRKLEREAMLELVREYDIDGIHFDYMRFPASDYCFCDGCKQRFQEQTGAAVTTWPDDVVGDGPLAEEWGQWRRDLLTSLVEEIVDAAHGLKPDVLVSLAAWSHLEAGREAYGQDWVAWARDGLLDFVCPMNYTTDSRELADRLAAQLSVTRNALPLYAGLGGFRLKSSVDLVEQVETSRAAGADGFVIFSYSDGKIAKWLPDLRATVTSADPNPTPHGHPPARFAFGGEAAAPPASGSSILAGGTLEVEIAIGWKPPDSSAEDAAGAEAAGAMLERALGVRDPIDTYDQRGPVAGPLDEDRLSGRIIVEAPDGTSLLIVGAFDSSYQFARTLRFPAPSGPFRVAIYGTLKTGPATKDFVVRGPLLHGLTEDELAAASRQREFEELRLYACDAPEFAVFEEFAPVVVHIKGTGSPEISWWVRFDDKGGCETGLGAPADPDLTFTATVEDFLAAANGTISTDLLFDSGRLHVTGDEELLAQLAEMFMGE